MPLPANLEAFHNPAIRITGKISAETYDTFRRQFDAAPQEGVIVLSVATQGGDPEVSRMIGEDVRMDSEVNPKRRMLFCGKVFVYSAGVTLMSYFARENRFLRRSTRLMIHERQEHQGVQLEGPLTSIAEVLRAKLNEVEESVKIQNEGFEDLIRGSSVRLETILERATRNWYLEAQEALGLGLVEAVL